MKKRQLKDKNYNCQRPKSTMMNNY